jgi:hypothetical protein
MSKSLEIYNNILETIPLAPLHIVKKMTGAQWDKAIALHPDLFSLRLAIEDEKRDQKARAKKFISR